MTFLETKMLTTNLFKVSPRAKKTNHRKNLTSKYQSLLQTDKNHPFNPVFPAVLLLTGKL